MPLILNGDGSVGPLSATEVGYLDGVTSVVQTQINSKPTGGTGAWISYTPIVSAQSGSFTNASATGFYSQVGKIVHFRFIITITTNGTAGSGILVTLPVTGVGNSVGCGRENNATGKLLQVFQYSTTSVAVSNYDNTYAGGSGYQMFCSITYEAA